MTDTATRTHVRIVNGGTPEFITTRAALDEMNAVQMDRATRRTVVRASITGRPAVADITYRNGERVVIRPATEDDRTERVELPKMTDRMARALLGAARNSGGIYATNIGALHATTGQAGGTSGALLRRGLIERRAEGTRGDGFYVTALGLRVAESLRVQG